MCDGQCDGHGEQLVRVVKGNPSAEELAALTAVLMSRAAAACVQPDDTARRQQAVALWRRPDRVAGFDGPRTWRAAARPDSRAA
ncbi:acyl-CoA carboxylase subunit epsilon [Streptomyces sp. ISL-36]|uniref:acyl-CoA carboxylase subunit epsilon n=1 Tax=Streptomyces sp. ISL-36 TaxID=2819182 RepID=UPI001BE78D5B|nr:acyl-CoA carboxylase subunit epsilon [Streptomyces sp. ISL-36]MBT2445265.1 acyl-CoA carboxylase subunit epsilon [Streptomyces sp. ISL-36]